MGYRNPLLRLKAGQALFNLPDGLRAPLERLMRELRAQANDEAENAWRRRKGPMAAYWRAVATYARHTAHALSHGKPATNQIGIQVGRELFRFGSFPDWVNHASSRYRGAGVLTSQTVAIDATGRICGMGKQFMSARDRNAFPVVVYHIEPEQHSAGAADHG